DDRKETPSKCIACGKCAKACPMGILEVVEAE
ncbi:MAG: 4Fe-4S binding protein, partial [Intestinibacter sp.]